MRSVAYRNMRILVRQVIRQTDAAHISRSIKKKKRIEEKKDDDDDVEAERERSWRKNKMMIFFSSFWDGEVSIPP